MYLNLLVQTVPWENLWTVIENIIYRFASTEHEVKTTLWCFNVNEKLLCYILFCILSSNIRMDNFVSFRPQVLRKKVSVTCHSDNLWLFYSPVLFCLFGTKSKKTECFLRLLTFYMGRTLQTLCHHFGTFWATENTWARITAESWMFVWWNIMTQTKKRKAIIETIRGYKSSK